MALKYTPRSSKSETAQLLDQLLKEKKQKAGALERILALPSALGSIPDIIYGSKYEGKNALSEYIKNLGIGLKKTITGEKEVEEDILKSTGDILKKENILQGKGWGQKIARTGLGLAGDILLDPTTYLSFGGSAIGKKAGQEVAEKLGKEALEKIGTKVAREAGEDLLTAGTRELTESLAKRGLKDTLKTFSRQGLDDVVEKLGTATKGMKLGRSVTAKIPFVGKGLTIAPESKIGKGALEALRFGAEPLAVVGSAGKGIAKKVQPEWTNQVGDTLLKIFDKGKLAEKYGYDPLAQQLKKTATEIGTTPRAMENQLKHIEKQVVDWKNKLPENLKAVFGDIIEKRIDNPLKEYEPILDKYRTIINPISEQLKERNYIKTAQEITEKTGQKLPEQFTEVAKEAKKFDNAESFINSFGDASKTFDDTTKNQLTDIFNQAREETPLSFLRRDVKGFKEDFIKQKHGTDALNIIDNPKAKQELDKLGYVTEKTYNDIVSKSPALKFGGGVRSAQSMMEDSRFARVYNTMEEGVKAGVVYNDDVFQGMVDSAVRGRRALAQGDLIDNLPKLKDASGQQFIFDDAFKKENWGGKVPPSYTAVNIGGKTFYTNKTAASIMQPATKFFGEEGAKEAFGLYDKILGFWKKSVTGLGPGFIGYNVRNAIGDATNMTLGGFTNKDNALGKALDVMKFENLVRKEGLDSATKKFGTSVANMYDQAIKKGILGADMGQIADEMGALERSNLPETVKGIFGKGKKTGAKISDLWKQIATVGGLAPKREEFFRVAMMADNFAKTNSWDEAAQAVRKTLFDYTDLTDTEKNVFKRVIPFYSFLRKNFEFHLNNYLKQPGKYTAMQHLFSNIRSMGGDLSEEDYNKLPDWMKTGMSLTLGNKNNIVKMITGFGIPTESVEGILGGNEGAKGILNNFFSSMAPTLKVPIEVATGKSFYTGKPILENTSGQDYAFLPETLRNLVGYREQKVKGKKGYYTKQTIDPYKAYAAQNIPILNSLLTQARRATQVKGEGGINKAALAQLLSGVRYFERNLDQEAQSRQREAINELEKELLRKGLGSSYKGFNLSKGGAAELQKSLGQ